LEQYNLHIEITKNVIEYLCQQADLGYESPYKQERIGFLFGTTKNRRVKITKAISYKGGVRKRSGIDFYADYFDKRGSALLTQLRKKWIGTYHTHVEEDDDISIGLSDVDRKSFIENSLPVELAISIWATNNSSRLKSGRKRLLAIKRFGDTNYRYVISGYINSSRRLKLVKFARI
jgi:proteasome lid subunit RPN8/RPN11